jgi:hypothetical protein
MAVLWMAAATHVQCEASDQDDDGKKNTLSSELKSCNRVAMFIRTPFLV